MILLSVKLIILYVSKANPYINEEPIIKYLFLYLLFNSPNKYPTTEKPNSHNRLFKPKE